MKFALVSGQRLACALVVSAVTLLLFAGYSVWNPGNIVTDGRHDLGSNCIWLQHGWLGDDAWFARTGKAKAAFRNGETVEALATSLSRHGIKYVFPHLCPTDATGRIAALDDEQTELFLDHSGAFKVLPWVGGVLGKQAFPESEAWRRNFIRSITEVLARHPRFAGVHVNIEPMPSGNEEFLALLRELRGALPPGKILSIAAQPPPTLWQPFSDWYWAASYFQQVSACADQVAVMMYDTSIKSEKVYRHVVSSWTREVLSTAGGAEILLGLPAYDDAGVGYHDPRVENLRNGLRGVHAGLSSFSVVPANYRGIAIYCEWEMDEGKWALLREEFMKVATPRSPLMTGV